MAKDEITKKVSLKDFINNNHELIKVLGVLFALVGFFGGIEDLFAKLISFFIYLMAVLVFVELWIQFPKSEKASIMMATFESLYVLTMLFLSGWLIYNYREYVISLSWAGFIALYGFIALEILKRKKIYEKVRRIAPDGNRFSTIIRGLFYIAFLSIIMGASTLSYIILRYISTVLVG